MACGAPGAFDHADLVDRLAGRAQQLGGALGVRGGDDENHADAAIEHALHLFLGEVAFALQPLKDFGPRQEAFLMTALVFSGRTRGTFSISPPPVI